MKKIILGKKDKNKKYDFRETCFGIYVKDNKLLVTFDPKYKQYTLIGGGIDNDESKHECLRREFKEEVGLKIKRIKHFITVDCFWLAGGDYPMESLANFFYIEPDKELNTKAEGKIEYIDLDKIDLPLPYQKKAIEILKKESNFK